MEEAKPADVSQMRSVADIVRTGQPAPGTSRSFVNTESAIEQAAQGLGVSGRGYEPYVNVALGYQGGAQRNRNVQFDIANTGEGHARQVLRIGSYAGVEGYYKLFDLTVSAADAASVSDQYGTKVVGVQGFSLLTCSKPMIVNEIRLISSDATQLYSSVAYKNINIDNTSETVALNLVASRDKSDQAADLVILRPRPGQIGWILDASKYFEFSLVDNKSVSIILYVSAIANVAQMVQV